MYICPPSLDHELLGPRAVSYLSLRRAAAQALAKAGSSGREGTQTSVLEVPIGLQPRPTHPLYYILTDSL